MPGRRPALPAGARRGATRARLQPWFEPGEPCGHFTAATTAARGCDGVHTRPQDAVIACPAKNRDARHEGEPRPPMADHTTQGERMFQAFAWSRFRLALAIAAVAATSVPALAQLPEDTA